MISQWFSHANARWVAVTGRDGLKCASVLAWVCGDCFEYWMSDAVKTSETKERHQWLEVTLRPSLQSYFGGKERSIRIDSNWERHSSGRIRFFETWSYWFLLPDASRCFRPTWSGTSFEMPSDFTSISGRPCFGTTQRVVRAGNVNELQPQQFCFLSRHLHGLLRTAEGWRKSSEESMEHGR